MHLLMMQALLVTLLVPGATFQSTLTEREETFDYIYQMIVDQYNVSQSYFAFIATIQVTFCPDQPICTNADPRSITNVSSTNEFTAYITNLTLTDDIHDLAGVCCLPCSCEDTCVEHGSCCMTKTALRTENDTRSKQANTKRMCIPTSSKSYFGNPENTLHFWHLRYSMVTQCPTGWGETDTVSKCEQPGEYNGFETKLPVTSMITGEIYWNYHCARCNNDVEDIMMWKATAIYPKNRLFYFTNKSIPTSNFLTFETLYDGFVSAEEVVFTPPNRTLAENARCYPTALGCSRQNSRTQIPENEFILEACEQFASPITISGWIFYTNVFCFFCGASQMPTATSTDCAAIQDGKNQYKSLSSLLNYQLQRFELIKRDEKKLSSRGLVGPGECNCTEVFDKHLVCIL